MDIGRALLRQATHSGIHCIHIHDHIAQVHQHFLLVADRVRELLNCRTRREQERFPGLRQSCHLGAERSRRFSGNGGRHHVVNDAAYRGKQWQMSGRSPLEKHARDEKPIDFIRSFEDAIDSGIAIVAFDRILRAVSVSAVDLYSLVHDEVENLASEDFQNRTFDGVFLDSL